MSPRKPATAPDSATSQGEEYFRHMADALPQMLWTALPNGQVDWVNAKWREYTGLSVDDTAGDGWQKAIHPEDHQRTAAAWTHACQAGSDYDITYRWLDQKGGWRWFLGRAVPVRDESGKIIKWFGSITDIHEKHLSEQQLQARVADRNEQTELLAGILSNFVESSDFRQASRDLLALAIRQTQSEYGFIGATVPGGPQGVTLRVFADQGFNWSPTTNRDLYEKIMRDYDTKGYIDFPRLDNLFGWPLLHGKTIVTNEPKEDERRSGRQPAGHPPLDSFMGVPIFKGETVVGMFGVANRKGGYAEDQAHDVQLLAKTASVIYENYRRQQNEQMLVEQRVAAEEKLKQSNKSLLDLSYVVSHELQEPLRIIRSDLGLLAVRYADRLGTDADEFIRNSIAATETVNRMVDDLWEYARIERPHVQFEPVSLAELFEKTLIALRNEIARTQAKVDADPLPVVKGDRRELAMLLRQLLLNAIVHNVRQPEIRITTSPLVDEVVICFEDNGVGFEPAEAGEIFKMFRKLDRDTPGTGMGLAICKKIVDFHSGRIWAESGKGLGSKFFVALPIAE